MSKTIRESLGQFYGLEGLVSTFPARIQDQYKKKLENYTDLTLEEVGNDYSEGSHYELFGTRPMTLAEIEKEKIQRRRKAEAQAKADALMEERERKVYETLKKKYGEK